MTSFSIQGNTRKNNYCPWGQFLDPRCRKNNLLDLWNLFNIMEAFNFHSYFIHIRLVVPVFMCHINNLNLILCVLQYIIMVLRSRFDSLTRNTMYVTTIDLYILLYNRYIYIFPIDLFILLKCWLIDFIIV